jgi:hypothetical protein
VRAAEIVNIHSPETDLNNEVNFFIKYDCIEIILTQDAEFDY